MYMHVTEKYQLQLLNNLQLTKAITQFIFFF